jgi:hypothetical protein
MNTVLLQHWQNRMGDSLIGGGCSLHLDINDRNNYVLDVYNMEKDIGIIKGDAVEVMVSDNIYELITNGYLRLEQYELNNLLNFDDILYTSDINI